MFNITYLRTIINKIYVIDIGTSQRTGYEESVNRLKINNSFINDSGTHIY